MEIQRDYYLNELISREKNGLIKIVQKSVDNPSLWLSKTSNRFEFFSEFISRYNYA